MSDDLIKREDAITAINKSLDRETLLNRFVRKIAIAAIIQVPSADRPQGKWTKDGCAKFSEMCNQCGFVQFEGRVDNFCPNCGAKMDGERKESE